MTTSTTALRSDFGPLLAQYGQDVDVEWLFLPAVNGKDFGEITSVSATLYDPVGDEIGAVDDIDTVTDGSVEGVKVTHNFGDTDVYPLGVDYRVDLVVTGTLSGGEETVATTVQPYYFDLVAYPLDASVSVEKIKMLYPSVAYNQRVDTEGEAGGIIRAVHADLYQRIKAAGYTPSTIVDRGLYQAALLHRAAADMFPPDSPWHDAATAKADAAWKTLVGSLRTMAEDSPATITTTIGGGLLRRL